MGEEDTCARWGRLFRERIGESTRETLQCWRRLPAEEQLYQSSVLFEMMSCRRSGEQLRAAVRNVDGLLCFDAMKTPRSTVSLSHSYNRMKYMAWHGNYNPNQAYGCTKICSIMREREWSIKPLSSSIPSASSFIVVESLSLCKGFRSPLLSPWEEFRRAGVPTSFAFRLGGILTTTCKEPQQEERRISSSTSQCLHALRIPPLLGILNTLVIMVGRGCECERPALFVQSQL